MPSDVLFHGHLLNRSAIDGILSSYRMTGEHKTGYEDAEGKGPFRCDNCRYFGARSTCNHPVMLRHSRQPEAGKGWVFVDPGGCCSYIDRGEPHAGNF
jgi:hypothetical protein